MSGVQESLDEVGEILTESVTDDEDREWLYIKNSEFQYFFKEIHFNLFNANTSDNGKDNYYNYPQVLTMLEEKFFGIYPLWSGLLMGVFCATQKNNQLLHLKKLSPNLVRFVFHRKQEILMLL